MRGLTKILIAALLTLFTASQAEATGVRARILKSLRPGLDYSRGIHKLELIREPLRGNAMRLRFRGYSDEEGLISYYIRNSPEEIMESRFDKLTEPHLYIFQHKGIKDPQLQGAGRYLKAMLREEFPHMPMASVLDDVNEKRLLSAFLDNPVSPNFSKVPAIAATPGPFIIDPVMVGQLNREIGTPYFQFAIFPQGARGLPSGTWINQDQVYKNAHFLRWLANFTSGR